MDAIQDHRDTRSIFEFSENQQSFLTEIQKLWPYNSGLNVVDGYKPYREPVIE